MSFQQRKYLHDNMCIPLTIKSLKAAGYTNITQQGHEHDSVPLRDLMKSRTDPYALIVRYKPDLVMTRDNLISLCEIKTELSGWPNFAIEIFSHAASMEYAKLCDRVLYSFFDFQNSEISTCKFCFVDDIWPEEIFVPQRWDNNKTLDFISKKYSSSKITMRHPTRSGSNTAYFFVKKDADFLRCWESKCTPK